MWRVSESWNGWVDNVQIGDTIMCTTKFGYVDMYKLPKFTEWKVEEPIESERYLVYRVGMTGWYSPHYTIRKYHNGSFGSNDVKYWIRLKELLNHEI